ncbi:MAG: hypothetical protein HPY65_05785 [Syntrophaceae bacterium]|nr:hypothetical protein [Syntrophaceae bacterium]
MLEKSLEKIAETILSLDEASLASLWVKYKDRMEHFEPSREWERAVIVFFIINAVRAKNQIFNDQLMKRKDEKPAAPKTTKASPNLRRVK